jgi:hypothetical protein
LINGFRGELWLESAEKTKIQGHDRSCEIDTKGVLEGNKGFPVVEHRRCRSKKQSQGQHAHLAFSIIDIGAACGISGIGNDVADANTWFKD